METKDILKELRRKAGYNSMQNFCSIININFSTYQNYESGKRVPTAEILIKLADFYGVTTDYLLGRPEAEPPADPVDEFVSKTKMLSNEQAALKKWLMLDEKKRKAVLDIMAEIIHEYESD